MLKISNLHARIGKKSILNGIDLEKYKDGLLLLTGGIENGFLAKPASLNNTKLVKP